MPSSQPSPASQFQAAYHAGLASFATLLALFLVIGGPAKFGNLFFEARGYLFIISLSASIVRSAIPYRGLLVSVGTGMLVAAVGVLCLFWWVFSRI